MKHLAGPSLKSASDSSSISQNGPKIFPHLSVEPLCEKTNVIHRFLSVLKQQLID